MRARHRDPLTVVIAAFNEAQALPSLHPRIAAVLDGLAGDIDGRVLYVDDGSSDGTWDVLQGIANGDARVSLLRLSRNFGKEAALTAGRSEARRVGNEGVSTCRSRWSPFH